MIDVVAGLIHDPRRGVLLAERPAGKHLAGFWEFPGGKIEPGETAEAALRRELDEELGLDVTIGEDLGEFTHVYAIGVIRLRVFVVRANNEPRATEAVPTFAWVDAVDVTTLAPADVAPWRAFARRFLPKEIS